METVLVTGGAGFIGSHLVEALLGEGRAVRVVDDLSSGRMDNLSRVADRIEFHRGDVRDADLMRELAGGVDYIIHQAALVSVPASVERPADAYDIIARGTLNVLEAARAAGVRRVVVAASSAVYGDNPVSPKTEDLPPRPQSPYAAAKAAAEMCCRAHYHSYGLESLCLRYFNVYGPRQDPSSPYAAVIPKFLEALRAGGRPVIHGDGEQTRDFVHVSDVVRANLLAIKAPRARGEAVNIGGGRSVSVNQILRVLSAILGRPPEAGHAPPRPGDVRHSLADITLARELLGYEPTVGLGEGLRMMVTGERQ